MPPYAKPETPLSLKLVGEHVVNVWFHFIHFV